MLKKLLVCITVNTVIGLSAMENTGNQGVPFGSETTENNNNNNKRVKIDFYKPHDTDETDNQVVPFKIPEIPNPQDPINIVKMWGQLSYEVTQEEKNLDTIVILFDQLRVVTALDKPFLSNNQNKKWKQIAVNLGKNITSPSNNTQYCEALENYSYPINALTLRLQTIKWVKEKLETGWSLTWPNDLNLNKGPNEIIQQYTATQIYAIRLASVIKKGNKVLEQLEVARSSAPETLSTFGTTKITELWEMAKKRSEYTSDQQKTLFSYLNVLMHLDINPDAKWFNDLYNEGIEKVLVIAEIAVWGKDIYSKMYYRWKLAVINQLEKSLHREEDIESLSWIKNVLPKKALIHEIPYPQTDVLNSKRLESLAIQKKKTLEFFNDSTKRLIEKQTAEKEIAEMQEEREIREALAMGMMCAHQ